MPRLWMISLVFAAHTAAGYEYRLQFNAASGARSLVVAGYYFNGNTVVGNCSYDTVSSGSGRVPRSTTTHHPNTCAWDLYGNLISLTAGAASSAPAPPIGQSGTEIIYASNGTSSTGIDTRGFGFVNTPSPHYSWDPSSGTYAVIPYAATSIIATLTNDGDEPLDIASASVEPSVSGTITPSPGTATVASTTCPSSLPVGSSCSFTVLYNPRKIRCTASPYGFAYTQLNLNLVTDSGSTTDYIRSFTITGVPVCDD